MSQSSETSDGEQRVTKSLVEAPGDQGLLNLLTQDTVFYVGGYPPTFKVGTWSVAARSSKDPEKLNLNIRKVKNCTAQVANLKQ